MKLSKTQLTMILQLEIILGWLLFLLLKTGFPLMKDLLKQLAKSVLITWGLTAAPSAADAELHKKFRIGSDHISNFKEEIADIVKVVKSLEESCLFITGVGKTIKN